MNTFSFSTGWKTYFYCSLRFNSRHDVIFTHTLACTGISSNVKKLQVDIRSSDLNARASFEKAWRIFQLCKCKRSCHRDMYKRE